MPITLKELESDYRVLRTAAGLVARHEFGRLRLTGSDRVDLLNRTSTGDLRPLKAGTGAQSIIQTETAKIIDWITLYQRADDLILLTGPGQNAEVAAWIERIVIMDDVVVEDITAETRLLEVCGPGAPDVIAALAGQAARQLPPHGNLTIPFDGSLITVMAGRHQDPPYYRIMAAVGELTKLIERLIALGAAPVEHEAAESLRTELGVPAVGRELTLDTNPLEAGLHGSISFDKGCYTGQEVIAKMITYKSTKRTLAGYRLPDGVRPPELWHWHPVRQGDEIVGRLTTVARSFALDGWIGLGILKREAAVPGTRLTVEPANHPAGGGPKLGAQLPPADPAHSFDIVTAALPFEIGGAAR